jgi:hypothetical protein
LVEQRRRSCPLSVLAGPLNAVSPIEVAAKAFPADCANATALVSYWGGGVSFDSRNPRRRPPARCLLSSIILYCCQK